MSFGVVDLAPNRMGHTAEPIEDRKTGANIATNYCDEYLPLIDPLPLQTIVSVRLRVTEER